MRIAVPLLARLLSVLLAVACIVVGAVLIVEVVVAWLASGFALLPDDVTERAQRWRWDERSIVITLIIIGAVGLVALLVGIWRRPPLTVPVEGRDGAEIERFAFEKSLRRRIGHIDGVSGVKVRATSNRVVVRADTNRRFHVDELESRVEQDVDDAVESNHVNLRPDVHVRHRGGGQ